VGQDQSITVNASGQGIGSATGRDSKGGFVDTIESFWYGGYITGQRKVSKKGGPKKPRSSSYSKEDKVRSLGIPPGGLCQKKKLNLDPLDGKGSFYTWYSH